MFALFLDGAPNIGGGLRVPRIEDSTKLLVLLQKRIALVDKQRWVRLFDVAEESRPSDIARKLERGVR